MNSTTTHSTIKTINKKLKMKNLVPTKCLIYLQRNPPLKAPNIFRIHEKRFFKTNMTTICQERHESKGKPYIFDHDPKFINLFDI